MASINTTNRSTCDAIDINLIENENATNNDVSVITTPSIKRGNNITNSKKHKATTSVEFKKSNQLETR